MARRANDKAIQADRRRKVAGLYLTGRSQHEIAALLKMSQGTVSKDLAWLQKEWLAASLIDLDQARALELARIDALERKYHEAWERSCKNKETKSAKQTQKGQKGGTQSEAMHRTEARDGNPAFLAGIDRCIERRCKLLGLDQPIKVAPTSPDGTEPYAGNTEKLLDWLLPVLEQERAAGRTGPAAAAGSGGDGDPGPAATSAAVAPSAAKHPPATSI